MIFAIAEGAFPRFEPVVGAAVVDAAGVRFARSAGITMLKLGPRFVEAKGYYKGEVNEVICFLIESSYHPPPHGLVCPYDVRVLSCPNRYQCIKSKRGVLKGNMLEFSKGDSGVAEF
jgi:hypothetical protein